MIGALVALAFACGWCLIVAAPARLRRPSLADRLVPYLRDVRPAAPHRDEPASAVAAVLAPVVQRAARTVGRVLGGGSDVRARLDRLGGTESLEQFRVRQVFWGCAGLIGSVATAVLWLVGHGTGALPLLLMSGTGFVAGIFACDLSLSSAVRAHEQRMAEEFPTVADLLALAVAAGESPVAGLERVGRVCHGDFAVELDRVLADVRTGSSVQRAFDALAARTGVASIARFAEGLAVAVERGTPLVDVLHAQAADVRAAGRRQLMEAGGRKEVLMMIPVVFLLLPLTVIFAFYPGWVGLHLTSGL